MSNLIKQKEQLNKLTMENDLTLCHMRERFSNELNELANQLNENRIILGRKNCLIFMMSIWIKNQLKINDLDLQIICQENGTNT